MDFALVIPAEGTISDTRDTTRVARSASCTPFLSGEAPRCQFSSDGLAAVCDRVAYCRVAGCARARGQFNASGAAVRNPGADGHRAAAGTTLRDKETKEDIVAIAAKKAPAKKAPARKAVKKRAVKKRAPAKKATARKTTARKTTKKAVKKRAVKKASAKKTTARKTAKKRAPAKKTAARKTTAKKVAKRRPAKKTAARKTTARKTTRRRTTKKAAKRA